MSKTSQRKLSYYQQGQSDARKGLRRWVPRPFLDEYRDGYAETCAQLACEAVLNKPHKPHPDDYLCEVLETTDTARYLRDLFRYWIQYAIWFLARPNPKLPTSRN